MVGIQIHFGIGALPCGSHLLLKSSLIVDFANLLLNNMSLFHILKTSAHQEYTDFDSTILQPAPPLLLPISLNDTFVT